VALGVAQAQGGSVSARVAHGTLTFALDLPVPSEPDA
jgi:hypothetical protein